MPTLLPIEDFFQDGRLAAVAEDRELGVERWLYEDGEVVLREGEEAKELYVLESGALRVETCSSLRMKGGGRTRRILATIVAEGDRLRAFGEMAFFLDGIRTATVRSTGACRVLRVSEEGIPVFFRRFPDLAIELFADVADKLRQTTRELEAMKSSQELVIEERFVGADVEEVLFEKGDPVEEFYLIVSGSVRMVDEAGAERIITEADPEGGFVGGRSYLLARPARERAVASSGTILQVVRSDSCEAVVRRFPQIALASLRDGNDSPLD